MNILLINDNPVVSRLLTLCTRDEAFVFEEAESVDEATRHQYDIVFVDDGSYDSDTLQISNKIQAGKKILLSKTGLHDDAFDLSIQKPFLPSQILAVLALGEPQGADETILQEPMAQESDEVHQTQVLDERELDKIKALLTLEDEATEDVELSEEELESRKIEAIKEQLIADGLEIVNEEEIVDNLGSEKTDRTVSDKKVSKQKAKKQKSKKKKRPILIDEASSLEDNMLQIKLSTLKPKKLKQLLKGKAVKIRLKLKDND